MSTPLHDADADDDDGEPEHGPFGEVLALVELWARHVAGLTYADLAEGSGISKLSVAASFALLAQLLADDLDMHGLPRDPRAELRAAVTFDAADADLVRALVGQRFERVAFAKLDRQMGGTPGVAATILALILESIFEDLRSHGFETDAVRAAQAAYDEENGNDGPDGPIVN